MLSRNAFDRYELNLRTNLVRATWLVYDLYATPVYKIRTALEMDRDNALL